MLQHEMNPYDYENRKGILPISWEKFHGLCKSLAAAVAAYQPEVILPVGRAGYYPGTLIAHMLQVELHPIRLSRRVKDVVVFEHPQWILEPPEALRGQRVLIVDEICSSGETLRLATQNTMQKGAASCRTAVLFAHTRGASLPDYIGLITDALILNPWDREIWDGDGFQFNPEYVQALREQGLEVDPTMLINAEVVTVAKG